MPITFENSGLIDFRTIRSFGVSAKPNSTNPIGQFGTGLKAAIAILLRLNHSVTLYRGLDRYVFGTRKTEIRGKEFDFVTMTGPDGTVEEMPFNTHVGEHWEPWCAFREMHSNALDENGGSYRGDYTPKPDTTAFVVEGPAMEEAYDQRDQIFLATQPISSQLVTTCLEVHPGPSNHIYFRGVRVLKLAHPSLFTYNLLKANDGLTEDRTLKAEHNLHSAFSSLACNCKDEDFLRKALVAPEGSYEYTIPSWWSGMPSTFFESVYQKLRQEGRAIALTGFANACWKQKNKTLPLPPPVELDVIQSKQLKRAIQFCEKLGWKVTDYPIIVVPQAPDGLMALAEDGKIVLTLGCFNQGTKVVAQALIEEYLHLKYRFADLTRSFQTHLFETIVTLGERLTKKPL